MFGLVRKKTLDKALAELTISNMEIDRLSQQKQTVFLLRQQIARLEKKNETLKVQATHVRTNVQTKKLNQQIIDSIRKMKRNGASNRAIAERLNISTSTVSRYTVVKKAKG